MGIWDALASVAKDRENPVSTLLTAFAVIAFVLGGMALMMAFPLVVTSIMSTGGDIMSGKAPVQALWRNCYDFKEIDGKVFRIDQCRGKMEPFSLEKPKGESP
ncbi:hypothetical protein [Bradyrhizobium zhanjiangense]|uniref:Uncharacterized protein n=1 Tax=Bradyrhizobium zhanjiangense TaxID=1325107 RepID=A0A4Q0SPJ5_9BRAD|nr:hypothetical protein [Bradyrhizobium zhanjiangense]RXH41302.1 hypothetical protein XH94_08955 [Bradyrhizobium zhanjiangense]